MFISACTLTPLLRPFNHPKSLFSTSPNLLQPNTYAHTHSTAFPIHLFEPHKPYTRQDTSRRRTKILSQKMFIPKMDFSPIWTDSTHRRFWGHFAFPYPCRERPLRSSQPLLPHQASQPPLQPPYGEQPLPRPRVVVPSLRDPIAPTTTPHTRCRQHPPRSIDVWFPLSIRTSLPANHPLVFPL